MTPVVTGPAALLGAARPLRLGRREVHPAKWGSVVGCMLMAAGFALIARF
jgi:hypothetical protein